MLHYMHGFLQFAQEYQILILYYPAHGTHVYQGLDVMVFGPLKNNWTKERDQWEQETGQKIDKTNFLTVHSQAHLWTLTPEMTCATFWKTGVWPFNPNVITDAMMAPSKETSCEGFLPVEPSSSVKLVAKLLWNLSLQNPDNNDIDMDIPNSTDINMEEPNLPSGSGPVSGTDGTVAPIYPAKLLPAITETLSVATTWLKAG
jgi:hypothetical protein